MVRMSSTCESVTGETKGSEGAKARTTGEGMRVERGDGEVDHITADMILRATSRSQVDLSACLFPCFRGRGRTSREGAAVTSMEGGGPERGGGGGAKGAGAAKATLPFGELRVLFFGRTKNDPGPEGPGPSPSRTSMTNTNMQRLPLATGQRAGRRARRAHRTRWVWNVGWKSTHIMCLLSSF